METVKFHANLLDLRGDPSGRAEAIVIETRQEKGFGIIATVLVKAGTLVPSGVALCGFSCVRFRLLRNESGEIIESAGPSKVVEITGLSGAVTPGDWFQVVDSEAEANEYIEIRTRRVSSQQALVDAENKLKAQQKERAKLALLREGKEVPKEKKVIPPKTIPVILKGDTLGALEAVVDALNNFPGREEVIAKSISANVGFISESDVEMAETTGAVLVAYNSKIPAAVRELAQRKEIPMAESAIIYDILDKIQLLLEAKLPPSEVIDWVGTAEVRQLFESGGRLVAGAKLLTGKVSVQDYVQVWREEKMIFDGQVNTLRYLKESVKEITSGEFGVGFAGWEGMESGDDLKFYRVKPVPRKLGEPRKTVRQSQEEDEE